ncbi:MAG TPA: AI-2E family transporter [Acidimicrobiia bacterium]|nr:AI-2E family transporter [Acidimicrobiia bacterium]
MSDRVQRDEDRLFMRRALIVALVIIGVAVVVWLIFRLSTVIFMVVVSVFITVAFEPIVHFLAKRGWKRGLATGLVFLGALLITVGFVWALVPLFVEQVTELVDAIPGVVESFLIFLQENFGFDLATIDPAEVGQNILSSVQNLTGPVAGGIVMVTTSIFGFLLFATTVALFSFYMLAELPQVQRTVLSAMPEEQQRRAMRIWDVAVEKMGGYVYSRLILAVISATLTSVFLSVLGVPFSISLGVWVGVLSQFVPVVGTYFAAILPALVALTFVDPMTALWVVVFLVAYQQVENYLISPRITKRTMEIHPAISVAAIIIGGTLLGGIGIILALPMAGIIQAIISETRQPYRVIVDGPDDSPTV